MNTAIQKFIVPSNLEVLQRSIFKNCQNLNEVKIDENDSKIKLIKSEAFKSSGINKITIPYRTRIIENNSFDDCSKLSKLCLFGKLKSLGISFTNCQNLKTITLSNKMHVKEIYENTFSGCAIEDITIPKSIKRIHKHSFLNCDKLKSIIFLDKVNIDSFAFLGCKHLETIKTDSSIKLKASFSDEHFPFNDNNLFVLFKKEITNKETINSLFINEKPTFKTFKTCNYKFSLILNDCYNINEPLELISPSKTFRWWLYKRESFFIVAQHINGGYYMNSKNVIYFVDNSIDSLSILKETKLIDKSAFEFSNLKKIDFQVGCQLEKIKKFAFQNLRIEEISIPDTVTSIGKQAFYNCNLLKKVNITSHSQLRIIKSNAFEKSGIESFLFPSTLEIIDDFAFFECFKLAKIENYSNQIEFGYKSLARSGIEEIKFPSISVFNDSSFKECDKLKEIIFNENVNTIIIGPDSFAFSGLEKLIIENDIEVKIFENAFVLCRNLKQVVLTGKNIECNENSFNFCDNINEFQITKITDNNIQFNEHYLNQIICRVNKNSRVKKFLFTLYSTEQENHVHKIIIENGCVVIDNKLIEANLINNTILFKKIPKSKIAKLLTSSNEIKNNEIIKVPSVVEKIDLQSFVPHIKQIKWPDNCIVNDLGPPGLFSYYNLVEITIPKLVQQIPPHLFEHCHKMKIVQFENGSILKEIGEFAFSNTSIEKVDLPNSVQIIKNSAFAYNDNLKEVKFNGEIIGMEAFFQTGLVEFSLSNNTKIIESSAFQHCRYLKKFDIDIENSKLTEIGPCSFYGTSITKINIPPDVKCIQKSVFNGCKYLKEVKISNRSKLESIEEYSFSGDLSLEMINIPKSISNLSFKAFINTPSLIKIMSESNEHFIVNENNDVYLKDKSLIFVPRNLKQFEVDKNCSVIHCGSFCGPILEIVSFKDNSLTCIEESGFAHSTSLKSITLPKSIKKIGSNAFIECQKLETVIFDSNCLLKKIPKFCFAFSGLVNIVLPKYVEIIDHFSFYLCKNLKNIDLYETNVRFIGDSAFSETSIEKVRFAPTIQFIENHSFEGTKSLKLVDFTSCSNVEDSPYKEIKTVHDFILENKEKKKKNKFLKIENSSSFQKLVPIVSTPTLLNPSTPRNNSPLIIRPSLGNVTPRNSYTAKALQTPSPQKIRKSLINQSPKIKNSKTTDEPKQLRAKLNITCYVQESAFHNSTASIFAFDLNEYQWFNFFNKCIQIKKIVINSNIHLYLKKLPKERLDYYSLRDFYDYKMKKIEKINSFENRLALKKSIFKEPSFDHLFGSFYRVCQLTWKNQDMIPWKIYGPKLKSIPKLLSPFHFMNTSNLISIIFTDDIEIECIPKCCFSNTLLEEITIPKSVITICRSAFQYSYGLRKVTFSSENKLKEIENYAFFDCKNLFTISLPDSISVIPEYCFASSGLKNIKLPNSIKEIYSGAFHHCENLKSVVLNEGLIQILCSSFCSCNSLINIDIPNSLTTIGPCAFNNCSKLSIVNIKPQSKLTFIKEGAFDYTSIKTLKLNPTIQEICNTRCMPKLTKIEFHEGELLNYVQNKDGIIYKLIPKPTFTDDDTFINSMTFDDLIQSIRKDYVKEDEIFSSDDDDENNHVVLRHLILKQQKIKKIFFIPKNITCLKYTDELDICGDFDVEKIYKTTKNYFVDLNQITQMKFLSKFVILPKGVFSYFNSLKSIEFGDDVNILELSGCIFKNCQNLNKIIIPNSCIRIDYKAFKNCTNLKTVIFGKIDESKECKSSLLYIESEAFCNCSSLQNIVLPPTVSRIGYSAFMNCSKLKMFEFGKIYLNKENKTIVHVEREKEKLQYIMKYAFKGCTSLTSFRIPKLCQKIEYSAFMNCTSLSKVSGVNSHLGRIESRAFYNCTSLTSFHLSITDSLNQESDDDDDDYDDEEKKKDKEKVPKTYFEAFNILVESFMNCTSLTEFIVENESKKMDTSNQYIRYSSRIYDGAFKNCTSLVKAKFLIGNLERIDHNAFMNCSSLKIIETNSPSYKSIVDDSNASFIGCSKDLKLDLFNNNKKVGSFNICVKKLHINSKTIFKNHLSSLNKNLISMISNNDDDKDKK